MNIATKKITFTALFAALCTVATLVIRIPMPLTGYVNIGDAFVLLSGWLLGGLWGGIAAGIGSALADIIAAYFIFAPATFIIKFVMPVIGYFAYKLFFSIFKEKFSIASRIISAALAELFMCLGYFVFEWIFVSFEGAVAAIVGNLIQGGVALILSVALITLLEKTKALSKFEIFMAHDSHIRKETENQ